MSNRKRVVRASLAASLAAACVAAVGITAAQAQTGAPTLTGRFNNRNASDPYVMPCAYPFGTMAICMYTSADLDKGGQNTYPMNSTYLYTMNLDPALDLNPGDPQNWANGSVVLSESAYVEAGWVSPGREHLWAPAAAPGGDGSYYLYVPDVSPDNDSNPSNDISHIGVSRSTGVNPSGPYDHISQVTYLGRNITNYYMSDPMVFQSMGDHPGLVWGPNGSIVQETIDQPGGPTRLNGPARWLLWANGYYETCGGLSIGLLDDTSMTAILTDPNPTTSEIAIGQMGSLGTCRNGHPYLEDPNLYFTRPWGFELAGGPYMLVFAAKPTDSRNQVIAYASAQNPRGPYTYEGILMEASTTSWTNQSSLFWDWNDGALRGLIFFHDDSSTSGNHNRKVYANCLTFNTTTRKFAQVSRPNSLPNLRNCAGLTS